MRIRISWSGLRPFWPITSAQLRFSAVSSGALSDYQILLTLDTQTLVNQGKMQPDGDDIRFTDEDDLNLLNYWIESGMNTTSTPDLGKGPNDTAGAAEEYLSLLRKPGLDL